MLASNDLFGNGGQRVVEAKQLLVVVEEPIFVVT